MITAELVRSDHILKIYVEGRPSGICGWVTQTLRRKERGESRIPTRFLAETHG